MKERLIEIIRSVPITDKTYEEYVEAVADVLLANEYSQAPDVERNVAREIFKEIYDRFDISFPVDVFIWMPRTVRSEILATMKELEMIFTEENKNEKDTHII